MATTATASLVSSATVTDGSNFRWSDLFRICAVCFFYNCQPSEPFLTRYLKEDKGISEHELDDYVWPFDTYGSFLFLIPAGILAESIGYRSAICVGLVLREMTRIVLLFGDGVYWAAFMQLTYAGATSVNYVYYAFVYMVFDRADFPFATGAVHAAYHFGNVVGSVLGQVLVDYTRVSDHLKVLFYLSWAFTSIGFVCFLCLPRPRYAPPPSLASTLRHSGLRHTFDMVKRLYRSDAVRLWSCWWIFGLLTHSIVSNYYQNQFYAADSRGKFGYAEAAMEMFSAAGACAPWLARKSGVRSSKRGDVVTIVGVTLLASACCLVSTIWTESIWISYVCNTIVLATYSALSAMACAIIPVHVAGVARRYALIFTSNSFVALGLATVLMETGSATHLSTAEFYYIATGSSAALVFIALPVLLLIAPASYKDCYSRAAVLIPREYADIADETAEKSESVAALDNDDEDVGGASSYTRIRSSVDEGHR